MEIGASARLLVVPSVGEARAVSQVSTNPARDGRPPDSAFQVASQPADKDPAVPVDPLLSSPEFSDALRRQITLDQETHKIVYEAVDPHTGDVVYQMPDLRYLKAYADQLKAADEEPVSPEVERHA